MANYLLMLFIIPGVLGAVTTLSSKSPGRDALKDARKKTTTAASLNLHESRGNEKKK